MKTIKGLSVLIGRILISLLFVESLYGRLSNFKANIDYVNMYGIHSAVVFLLIAASVLEFTGLLLISTGFKIEIGAICLLVFMIPITFIFHAFWKLGGMDMVNQMIHFMKNISIIGALFFILGTGAGPFSIDSYLAKKK
jgi:putative oxidoreductase